MEKYSVSGERLGFCSWSLGDDLARVEDVLKRNELHLIHLNSSHAKMFEELLERMDVRVSAMMLSFPQEDYSSLQSIRKTGGIVPDEHWESNKFMALRAIDLTAKWNVPFLTTHIGFIDPSDREAFERICSRLLCLADAASESGIRLLLETGQEKAEELKSCLELLNHPSLGVNFDPANMILYGKGNPIEAVKVLAPWIEHIHLKDAIASDRADEWGTEVPLGEGEVNSDLFLKALEEIEYQGYFAIERESGASREQDIAQAVELVTR